MKQVSRCLILALVALCALLPAAALAVSEPTGDTYNIGGFRVPVMNYNDEWLYCSIQGEAMLLEYLPVKTAEQVRIPGDVDGVPVTRLGAGLFPADSAVKVIEFDGCLQEVDPWTFGKKEFVSLTKGPHYADGYVLLRNDQEGSAFLENQKGKVYARTMKQQGSMPTPAATATIVPFPVATAAPEVYDVQTSILPNGEVKVTWKTTGDIEDYYVMSYDGFYWRYGTDVQDGETILIAPGETVDIYIYSYKQTTHVHKLSFTMPLEYYTKYNLKLKLYELWHFKASVSNFFNDGGRKSADGMTVEKLAAELEKSSDDKSRRSFRIVFSASHDKLNKEIPFALHTIVKSPDGACVGWVSDLTMGTGKTTKWALGIDAKLRKLLTDGHLVPGTYEVYACIDGKLVGMDTFTLK